MLQQYYTPSFGETQRNLKNFSVLKTSAFCVLYIVTVKNSREKMEQNVIYIFVFNFIFLVAFFALLELYSINLTLKDLVKAVKIVSSKPGIVVPLLKDGENDMLKFYLALPEKSAPDVVGRELTVSIAGGEPVVYSLAGDALQSEFFSGADNDIVTGTLVDIDDAGNKSQPSEFSFALLDTIPPATPGAVGLVITDEA